MAHVLDIKWWIRNTNTYFVLYSLNTNYRLIRQRSVLTLHKRIMLMYANLHLFFFYSVVAALSGGGEFVL